VIYEQKNKIKLTELKNASNNIYINREYCLFKCGISDCETKKTPNINILYCKEHNEKCIYPNCNIQTNSEYFCGKCHFKSCQNRAYIKDQFLLTGLCKNHTCNKCKINPVKEKGKLYCKICIVNVIDLEPVRNVEVKGISISDIQLGGGFIKKKTLKKKKKKRKKKTKSQKKKRKKKKRKTKKKN
tara:strand:- start:267 stop:821 length:555 start_codon:yes stop_codon:yes gene_type:complete